MDVDRHYNRFPCLVPNLVPLPPETWSSTLKPWVLLFTFVQAWEYLENTKKLLNIAFSFSSIILSIIKLAVRGKRCFTLFLSVPANNISQTITLVKVRSVSQGSKYLLKMLSQDHKMPVTMATLGHYHHGEKIHFIPVVRFYL